MRRSTYLVVHPDGRSETLDRDALVARASAGDIRGTALISIGGGRQRAIAEHPAFAKYFEGAGDALSASGASARYSHPGSPTTPSGPRPVARQRSPMDPPATLRASGAAPATPQALGSPELEVSASATEFDDAVMAKDAVELRNCLWVATPEQVVGCLPEAGRSVVLRAAGLRQRQLRARIDASTEASDRIRLEEAARCIDAAMRIVSQPGRWRSWQEEVVVTGGDTSVGAFAKIQRGDLRASGAVRRLSDSGASRRTGPQPKRRVVASGPDVLGKEMLAAAGVEGFQTRELDDDAPPRRPGERRRTDDTSAAPAGASKGASEVPEWLKAPVRLFAKGSATEGPITYGVGTDEAGGKAVGIALGIAFGVGGVLAFGGPGAATELTPDGAPLAALLRLALALLVAALVLHVMRKEAPSRAGWPIVPQDAMIACGAALPGLLLFALFRPLPLEDGAALGMLPLALLLRAVVEWAIFDLTITRTLLIETKKREAAIAAGALLSGLYALTYAQVWTSASGSPVHALFWALAVGLPAAWSVYRSGSALPALAVRAVILIGGTVVGTALA